MGKLMKVLLFFAVFIVPLVFVYTPMIHAQESWYAPTLLKFSETLSRASRGELQKEGHDTMTQMDVYGVMTCSILGCSEDALNAFNYNNSAIAHMGGYIASIYANPPADLAYWIYDTGQTLGFIPKTAYAQGIGFSGLTLMLPLWKAFRNVAYALLAVVMIIIGFMVMLRKKIDPKTVVTVQNAIPNIVVTLLLITFSYAIVGFMIDLMYFAILLVISILVSASGGALGASVTEIATTYTTGHIGTVIGALFGGGLRSIDDIVGLFGGLNAFMTVEAVGAIIGFIAAITGKGFWQGAVKIALGIAAAPLLLTAIVSLAILFAVVRIIFMLVGAYVSIILSLLTAPLQLLVGAFPGSKAFENWLKNLAGNILVFPITTAMILIGTILTSFEKNPMNVPGFGDPTLLWGPPLVAPAGRTGLTGIIGIGILFTIPSIVNSFKESLKAKAPIEAGPGAILGPIGAAAGQAMTNIYYLSFIKNALSGMFQKSGDKTAGGQPAH